MTFESEYLFAVLLGLLEGLTEFIPVSSTGHLVLLQHYLGFTDDAADTFAIFIQLGAILAVVVLYKERFLGLFKFSESESSGFRGWDGILKLFVACLPAFVSGFLLHKYIKSMLFFPVPIALALLVGGVVMIFVERTGLKVKTEKVEDITLRQCFAIGCFQCLALWPGMSRSGSTIIGGLCVGLNRTLAAEFSFLVAVPVMCAAVGYDLLKSATALASSDIVTFAIGFIISFVTAVVAIKWFMKLLSRWTLAPFGVYRVLLAILVLSAM